MLFHPPIIAEMIMTSSLIDVVVIITYRYYYYMLLFIFIEVFLGVLLCFEFLVGGFLFSYFSIFLRFFINGTTLSLFMTFFYLSNDS